MELKLSQKWEIVRFDLEALLGELQRKFPNLQQCTVRVTWTNEWDWKEKFAETLEVINSASNRIKISYSGDIEFDGRRSVVKNTDHEANMIEACWEWVRAEMVRHFAADYRQPLKPGEDYSSIASIAEYFQIDRFESSEPARAWYE